MDFTMTGRKPSHPGEIFKEEVLEPLGISITKAAALLGVSRKTLSEFVNCKAALSPEMAIRIAKATNTSAQVWLGMQLKLTLWEAQQKEVKGVVPSSLAAPAA